MFLDMHEKYFAEAVSLIGSGEVQAALPLVQDSPVDADGRDPFDVSICL